MMTGLHRLIGVGFTAAHLAGCWADDESTTPAPTPAAVASPAAAPKAAPHNAAGPGSKKMLMVLIDAEPDSGPAPLTVDFDIYDPYQTMAKPVYRWNFGDGSPESDQRGPVHVYDKPGRYKVTLRVEEDGETDEDSTDIVVKPPPAE